MTSHGGHRAGRGDGDAAGGIGGGAPDVDVGEAGGSLARASDCAAGAAAGGRGGPIAALGELIRLRGLKRSRQRDVIARAFFEMEGHVPVEALAARVRRLDPRISVATVYRTMKLLSDGGLAVPRQFGDGQTRYEAVTRRHAGTHDHLICTSCGAITEFESQRIADLQLRVARRHGFEVERRHVELYGRCSECRRSPGKREPAA